jgi:hypothetical protein
MKQLKHFSDIINYFTLYQKGLQSKIGNNNENLRKYPHLLFHIFENVKSFISLKGVKEVLK